MDKLSVQRIDFFIGLTVLFIDINVALLFLQFCIHLDCVVLLFDDFVFLPDFVLKVSNFLAFVHFDFGPECIELFFHENVFFNLVFEGLFDSV